MSNNCTLTICNSEGVVLERMTIDQHDLDYLVEFLEPFNMDNDTDDED